MNLLFLTVICSEQIGTGRPLTEKSWKSELVVVITHSHEIYGLHAMKANLNHLPMFFNWDFVHVYI